ncbi:response regulator transcription factor [Mordavella massiliensis]|uniref:Stage 0 sporulation protein A homolog n=1 Tax=Mordavella massiliensis TaxID=1871024 RepID=A0A938X9A3_9CLOT|nr:response regulator [Mordavella massiliensis]MBM6947268.1 response regulator [Mordavella massiliensis]
MKTLIVVEDELRIREGLCKLIRRLDMGVKVIGEAEDGLEGLKMIQDMLPDIVITDIRMPKMEGLEMIRKVREMNIRCIFIILSGYAEFSYAQTAISYGVTDYLLKPVTVSDVKRLLEKLNPQDTLTEREAPGDGGAYSDLVYSVMNAVKRDYATHISLSTYADVYKVTPQYISTLFTKETGETFSSYVRRIRMEKAKELLLTTDMKIYEVALAVGYPEQKYFSKVFKEYTGVSAKQFVLQKKDIKP